MKEEIIIEKLKKREDQGLEEFMMHYGPLMRYVMAPFLPDQRDLEECLQDAALKVWREIERFNGEKGSWTGWLTAVARNLALNKARAAARHAAGELAEEAEDPAPSPERQLLRQERQAMLLKALDKLSESDRLLFYRKYYYRQSTAQIAGELITTERAVEGRLYRIRNKLKKLLEGEL